MCADLKTQCIGRYSAAMRKSRAREGVGGQVFTLASVKFVTAPTGKLICAEQLQTSLRGFFVEEIVRVGAPKMKRVFLHGFRSYAA